MGINDEETDEYRACRVCTHTCQTTHDKGGKPVVVPRFYKTLSDSAVHSCRNPYLCVPSGYIRDHIGKDVKEDFVLEDAMGSEWAVVFNRSGVYGGWKSFAADHCIERGDHLVAALTGTNRFLVHVFDKNGMEKFGTGKGSPPKIRSSKRKASMDGDVQLALVQIPNREGGQAAVPKVRQEIENGQNGQNGAYTLNRVTDYPPKLTLGRGQHSIEPQECYQGESSAASETSADSVEVLLAKAVLARAKRKKLRQRSSAASQERLPKVNPRDGVRCGPHYKVTQDVRARRKEGLITNGGLDEIEEHGVAQDVFVEELHHNKDMAMEDQGVAVEDQGVAVEDQGVAVEDQGVAVEDQGVAVEDLGVAVEDLGVAVEDLGMAVEDQGVVMEDQGVVMEDQERNIENPPEDPEAAAHGMQHQSNGVVAEEQEHGSNQQSPSIFQASLVKEEPMFEMEANINIPEHNVRHDDGKCANCGLPATPPPLPGVGVLNAVMIKSEDCEQLAEESPVKSPKPRTPRESPHPRRPSKSVPVTEGQKQKALEAANAFSAETQNPSAVVAMRISFVEKTCSCFLSVKCAAIFPKVTRSLELEDSEGCVRKANWRPERRYMQGSGWKDFVDSHALEVDDVCVMEVVVNKEEDFRVRVHVFRAHAMRKDEVIPVAPSGARTHSEAKEGLSPGMSTLINHRDEKKRRHAEDKDGEQTPVEKLRKVVGRSKNLLTRESPVSKRVSKRTPEPPAWLKDKAFSVEANGEPSKVAKPGPTKALKQSKKKQGTDDSETLDATTPASTTLGDGSGFTQEKSARKQKKLKASSVDINERRKSTNDKIKSQKLYNVVRLLDRRKGLNGVVFLVELDGEVIQSHKKGKVKQDESGHWWVPYDHFTSDFISCYID